MASIAQQAFAVAAGDAGILTWVQNDPTTRLVSGHFGEVKVPLKKPFGEMQLLATVPTQPDPRDYQGILRWVLQDIPAAGWARIEQGLALFEAAYGTSRRSGTLWYDAATREDVWRLEYVGRSNPFEDQDRQLFQRWLDWSYRITYRRA